MIPIKAIVPAAGYATRLYPLTKDKPKALLDIAGKPMIGRIMEKILEVKEVDEVVIVTNALFFRQFNTWVDATKFRAPVRVLDDGTTSNETRLGAIGDWWFGIEKGNLLGHDLISVSSDNLFNFSINRLVETFRQKKGSIIGTFDLKDKNEAKKMGIVDVDANGRVIAFVEKPETPPSTLASIGIYLFSSNHVRLMKKYLDEGNTPDKPGHFIEWLFPRTQVYGHAYDKPADHWYDIGTLDTLEQVRKIYAAHKE